MKQLFNYISKRIALSKEAKEFTKSVCRVRNYKKGSTLILENQSVTKTYFVVEGCLRSFVFDNKGNEHTLQFALKDNWISDYIAIFNNAKASQVVECITDSIVIESSIEEGLENIFSKYSELESLHRKNLQRHIVSLQTRILNQLQLSSLERYILFLKQYPNIEKYALNYHIASYLGITQQSLSRLRSEKIKK